MYWLRGVGIRWNGGAGRSRRHFISATKPLLSSLLSVQLIHLHNVGAQVGIQSYLCNSIALIELEILFAIITDTNNHIATACVVPWLSTRNCIELSPIIPSLALS